MREQNIVKATGVNIPPLANDEWYNHAACYDQHPVTLEMCDGCPVVPQCRLLYKKLNATVHIELGGVWGGHDYGDSGMPQRTNSGGGRYKKGAKPINGGTCSLCDSPAYRRGLCNPHYRRNKSKSNDVILELDKGDIDG